MRYFGAVLVGIVWACYGLLICGISWRYPLYQAFPLAFTLATIGLPFVVGWSGWVIGQQKWMGTITRLLGVAAVITILFLLPLADPKAPRLFPALVGIGMLAMMVFSASLRRNEIRVSRWFVVGASALLLLWGIAMTRSNAAVLYLQRGLGLGISLKEVNADPYIGFHPNCALLKQLALMRMHPGQGVVFTVLGMPGSYLRRDTSQQYLPPYVTTNSPITADLWSYRWSEYHNQLPVMVSFDNQGRMEGIGFYGLK